MDESSHEGGGPPPLPVNKVPPPESPAVRPGPLAPPSRLVDLRAKWRAFFDLTGGSILYCVSALSIIYGISQIMGPLLLRPGSLRDALPCIATLNVYELALLGTLLFIVVLRQVTDDAISLVILIPLFLIGSGIALDTVAHNGTGWAIGIGALCAMVGFGKLTVLRRWIRIPLRRGALAGLSLVVLWNFLAGPALVRLFGEQSALDSSRRDYWLGSLLLLLLGGGSVLAQSTRGKEQAADGKPVPFLRTPAMICIFTLVLLAAAGAHLYAIGYMLDVHFAPGDFMALGALGALMFMEALYQSGEQARGEMAAVGCAPLAAVLWGLASNSFIAPFKGNLELLGHPMTTMLIGGFGMTWFAWRTRWAAYLWIAAAYAAGFVLTAGYTPGVSAHLNWRLAFGLGVAGLFAAGVVLKRSPVCVLAVVLAAMGLGTLPGFEHAVSRLGLQSAGGIAGAGGLGLIAVAAWFREERLLPVAVIGTAALIGSAFDYFGPSVRWLDLLAILTLAVAGFVLWWRTRRLTPIAVLCIPPVERLWLAFQTMSAWRYVLLSFVLLGAGAWLSSIKKRKADRSSASTTGDGENGPSV